jgi:serine phosphatase RsbU (regulator of sigma subunit)
MTIRTRLTVTQTMIGAVVIALCVVAIDVARLASDLARMPAQHVGAFGHIHDLLDGVVQATKDLDDIVKGEDDFGELAEEMTQARTALANIRADAHDPLALVLLADVESGFAEFVRQQAEVLAVVEAGQLARANELAFTVGEDYYEHRFRPAIERLEQHAIDVTEALRDDGAARARTSLLAAILLVLIGVVGTAIGTAIVFRIQRRLTALASTAAELGANVQQARSKDVTARDELGDLGRSFNRMADEVSLMLESTAAAEALASELALAVRMQQALLPPAPRVAGLDIAGAMAAATEVGGDYYDVLPLRDGAWIAIGDVSGHGFNTGIVTLLAQSAIASVTRARPDAEPGEVLRIVNDVLHDLVRVRLGLRDHMTVTLLRYRDDGTVQFAGAHQEIVVRGADGTSRTIETTGPWLAVLPDISKHLVAGRFQLAPGETMVLFTDGVVEARAEDGQMFGLDRLIATVTALPPDASAQTVRDAVFARVRVAAPRLDDDATILAIRRLEETTATRIAS